MKIGLKGPEGVLARMQELQSRIDAIERAINGPASVATFANSLKGEIGKTPATGNTPLSPFSSGLKLDAPHAPSELLPLIQAAANDQGVDPALFEALISVESEFNPRAVSAQGAQGLSQLMPTTSKALGISDPFDPQQNLKGGAQYFSQLLSRFGDAGKALAAYNAGPNAVERFGGIPPYPETQEYVKRVLDRYEKMKASP